MTTVSDSRVTLEGYIVVSNSNLPQVLQELPNHIKFTKAEEGCLLSSVSQRSDEPNIFNVFEEFSDKAAFDAHQERVRRSVWGRVAANVDRHYKAKGITSI